MNRLLTIEHLEAKGCRELNTFFAEAGHSLVKCLILMGLMGRRLSTKLGLPCEFSSWSRLWGRGRIWGKADRSELPPLTRNKNVRCKDPRADGWPLWSPTHRAMKLRDGWGTHHFGVNLTPPVLFICCGSTNPVGDSGDTRMEK